MATQGRRRALGQHFLKDSRVIETIVDRSLAEMQLKQCSQLLEIGPGRGALTHAFLKKFKLNSEGLELFTLIERDENLAKFWLEYSRQEAGRTLRVIPGDFLKISAENWLQKNLAVVSNLPYSAGTAILNQLSSFASHISFMMLMFQSEVAQRLYAQASTKQRGSLSLWIQNDWDIEKVLLVPPSAFNPPPAVMSEVLLLKRRSKPRIFLESSDKVIWEKLLKACFAQRRKMLRSTVPWRNALEIAGVDGTKRAEGLEWEEWEKLFQAVRKVLKD